MLSCPHTENICPDSRTYTYTFSHILRSEDCRQDYRILHNTIEKLRDYGAEIAEYIMVIDSDSDNFSMKTKLISDK